MTTWYDILQVSPKASTEVIEMAYKALVKKYHPDIQTEGSRKQAEEKMKLLNQAREILTNPDSRKQYDVFLVFQQQIDKSKASKPSGNTDRTTQKNLLDRYVDKIEQSIGKCPNWVRWITAIPVFVFMFYLSYTLLYLFYHNTFGYIDKKNIVWTIVSQPFSIGLGIYALNIFLPKYKFIFNIIVSCIISVILTNPIYTGLVYTLQYTTLSYVQCILTILLVIPMLIYICFQSFKAEYK